MSRIGLLIEERVNDNTKDDVVDLLALAKSFKLNVKSFDGNSTDKGYIDPPSRGEPTVVMLNSNSYLEEQNTTLALLLAELLIHKENNSFCKRISVDIFFLNSIREFKQSRQVLLATRLAIPMNIIALKEDINFSHFLYSGKSKLLSKFIDCAYRDTEADSLLSLLDKFQFTNIIKSI